MKSLYTRLAATIFRRNLTYSRLITMQIRLIHSLLFIMLLSLIGIGSSNEANYTVNQYIPVNNDGTPIKVIRGDVQHLTDEEVTDWVAKCSQKALSMSPSLYRKHFMEFASRCLPPSQISEWGQTLESSGYMSLVEDGSILEFKPETVEMTHKKVIKGRLYWRYTVKGTLLNAKERVLRTKIDMDLVVARQDPFNYEKAIAITRVVL